MLNHLYNTLKSVATESTEIYSDLPGQGINGTTIPQDILVANGQGSKPDLTIIDRKNMKIALLELTCPLERNIEAAHTRKLVKYTQMQLDLESKGFSVQLVPFEIGSAGHIFKNTKEQIMKTLSNTLPVPQM